MGRPHNNTGGRSASPLEWRSRSPSFVALIVHEFIAWTASSRLPAVKTRIATAGSRTAAGRAPTGTTTSGRASARSLEKPRWRNTTIIRDDLGAAVRALKAQPGRNILLDGSSQLVHTLLRNDLVDELYLPLCPLTLGGGKRLFPDGMASRFTRVSSKLYPTGVLALHYAWAAA